MSIERIETFSDTYKLILEELTLHEIGKIHPQLVDGYLTYVEKYRTDILKVTKAKNILFDCYSYLQEENQNKMDPFHDLQKKALEWKDLSQKHIEKNLEDLWKDVNWLA